MSTFREALFGQTEGTLGSTQIDILLLLVLFGLVVEATLVEFPAADDVGDGSGDKKDRPLPPITQDECRRTAAAAAANNPLASGSANELVEWRLYLEVEGSLDGNNVLVFCDSC